MRPMQSEADIRLKIAQHEDNLRLWLSGYLTPTEPVEEVRRVTIAELRAAIYTLKWVLGEGNE